ncbi:substrate-binding protein [Streptomyces cavernae]|uniref:substrate-binding protein n=1 Tax=Streptomyces cavernae TaxID=2259034 RepID=UPI000FEB5F5C|nr:substrate-binding protein [Streptomyces cavernae]
MHEIVLVNETHLGVPPHEAFGMFGRTGGPGWLFSARFERAEPGAAAGIDIPLPFAAPGGETTVRGTARIVEMRPYRRIVLQHETPWTGRITITFAREPGGTRVRTVTELDQGALGWMTGSLGRAVPDGESPADETCVALLTSMSGSAGLFGRAAANCAALAAEEINAEGGIGGRPVRVEVIDDRTHAATGLARLRELDQRRGLAAVVGVHSSATFNAVSRYARASGLLYLYTAANEGSRVQDGTLFRLGESVADQLAQAVPSLMRESGGRSWYLIGNDYSWPRAVCTRGRRIAERHGGHVVGERFVRLGESSFDDVLEDIEASGADLVLSSLVGWSSIDFERRFHAAGLRRRIRTLAPLLEESTREHLGAAGSGVWSCLPYFSALDTAENADFLRRYRAAFGPWAPSPSALTESAYEGLQLFARAARKAGSPQGGEVSRALHGLTLDGPRGRVSVGADGRLRQSMYLAEATATGFAIRGRMPSGTA